MTQPIAETRTRRPYQWLALIIGIVFLLVGIAGWFVTGFSGWTSTDESRQLLGFGVNPLHNVVHLLLGLLGVLMWRTRGGARGYGWILVIGYGAASVYGLIVVNQPHLNVLNINGADNGLHIGSTILGLIVALWPDRRTVR